MRWDDVGHGRDRQLHYHSLRMNFRGPPVKRGADDQFLDRDFRRPPWYIDLYLSPGDLRSRGLRALDPRSVLPGYNPPVPRKGEERTRDRWCHARGTYLDHRPAMFTRKGLLAVGARERMHADLRESIS